jgi:SurA-like protein
MRGLAAVRTPTRIPARLVAALTALVMVLTACGTGPGQLNTAVIVDGHAISVDEVQGILSKIVREQPAAKALAKEHKLDLVSREIVSQLVVHELLTQAAKDEGLRIDPEQLNKELAKNPLAEEIPTDGSVPPEALASQLVYRGRDLRDYVSDQLLLTKLADRYFGKLSATYRLVPVEKADDAKALAERVVADPRSAPAEFTKAAGPNAGMPDPTTGQVSDPAQPNQSVGAEAFLLAAPNNSVLVLPAGQGEQGGGGFQVVQVLSHEVSDKPQQGGQDVDPSQMPTLGRFLLRPYALDGELTLNPRYGVWNALMMNVVPKAEAEVSGLVLTPGSTASEQ